MKRSPRAFLEDIRDPSLRETIRKADAAQTPSAPPAPPPPPSLTIDAMGTPRPAGSKTAFPVRKGDGSLVLKTAFSKRYRRKISIPIFTIADSSDNAEWKADVARGGRLAMEGRAPYSVPLRASFRFRVLRPQDQHEGNDRSRPVREQYRTAHPAGPPDTTKLIRCAEDALTGIVWADDALIVRQSGSKVYARRGQPPGLTVHVQPIYSSPAPLFGDLR